jgi:hypothetical protein
MARKTIFIARRDGHAMREDDLRVKERGGGGGGSIADGRECRNNQS